ncbi:MAG: SDR family oxidoreductase [Planctomycetota bacterium]
MPSESPVYLLIGGGGGQGRAVARRLAKRESHIVFASRDGDRVREAASEIGGEARTLDATDFGAVESLVSDIFETQGRLDGVANLAGSILIKPPHMVSEAEFEQTIGLNARTAFATVRAAARPMGKQGRGSIVLMSSCAARTGLMNHEVIAAAKGAVIGLTQSAAATYAASGVRVNCVAPGLVDTPMAERLTKSDAARKASESMHALGRLGQPEDVAPAIEWLLTNDSSWVTGQTVGVDGGLAAIKGTGK